MMNDFGNRIFFCYAWEDLAEVQHISVEIEHELSAKVNFFRDETSPFDIEKNIFPLIDRAEVVLVFVSEASKNSETIKKCVKYSLNLNKRILPVEIGKLSLFSSLPAEFKFRTKPIVYRDENQKSKFFAQLKAAFGMCIENGDSFGALIHITTDTEAIVYRYGKVLCHAKIGEDNVIRLNKGVHKLDFASEVDSSVKYSTSYEVISNEGEQFIDVPLSIKLKEIKEAEERAVREAEQRKKYEAEQFQKNLELEQKRKELAVQKEQQEVARRQQELERQQQMQVTPSTTSSDGEKKSVGCWTIGVVVLLTIMVPYSLIFTIPFLIWKSNKRN